MANTNRFNPKSANLNGENTDRQARRIAVVKDAKRFNIERNRRTRDYLTAVHDDLY